MKLPFHSNTATAVTAVLFPVLTSGYNVGSGPGFMFGRPIYITTTPSTVVGRCVSPRSSSSCKPQRDWVDNAFEKLESEMKNEQTGFSSSSPGGPTSFRRGGYGPRRRRGWGNEDDINIDKEAVEAMRKQQAQQQELFNKALDLANDVVNGIARETKVGSPQEKEEMIQQQKMWLDRAFGLASDVFAPGGRSSSSSASPRFEVSNNDEKFQIELDVPGVKPSDIDIRLVDDNDERSSNSKNDKVLVIMGKRERPPAEFKKEFIVDASVIDTDSIAAQINNGVLVVTADKIVPKKKEPMQATTTSDDQQVATVVSVEKDDGDSAKGDNDESNTSSPSGNDEEEEQEESAAA
jgi:HSP20 family protein